MKIKCAGINCSLIVTLFAAVLVSFSCSNIPADSTSVITTKKHTAQQKPSSSFKDTTTINVAAAVFYNPDSLQLNQIKAVTDTAIFESMVHDCFFQMRNSRLVLKKYYPALKVIEVKNARYIGFTKAGGENTYIDLDTKNDPCGLFIFTPKKAPVLVDMTNVETELGFYFSR